MNIKFPAFILLFSIIITHSIYAQNLQWAKTMEGTGIDCGYSVAVDSVGNVYSIGTFMDTVDFDPGTGVYELNSDGAQDIFIYKSDINGNFVWAKAIGGTGTDFGASIVLDGSGNCILTGGFSNTVDFDPGSGTINLTSNGNFDIFISKLDADGNFIWAKAIGGVGSESGQSLSVNGSDCYVTGSFSSTVDFDTGPGIIYLSSAGSTDIFINKFDANGNTIWAKAWGGPTDDVGRSISVDMAGNVYSTGNFGGVTDFDPGSGISNLTSSGSWDIFISKLDANGNYMWAKSTGGTSSDVGTSIAVDASGNCFITGRFFDTVDFDPGSGVFNLTSAGNADVFISKLDANGNFVWANALGGLDIDQAYSITLDVNGDVYATGRFSGLVDMDPGQGMFNLTAIGATDIFILNLESGGNFLWATNVGGTGSIEGRAMAVDGAGNVYATGLFTDTVDFDPGPGVFNIASAGFGDFFILKLSITTDLTEISESFGNYIYPNPNNGLFSFAIKKEKINSIDIYNEAGQIVYSRKINSDLIKVDLREQPAGLYFYKFSDHFQSVKSGKFLIQY